MKKQVQTQMTRRVIACVTAKKVTQEKIQSVMLAVFLLMFSASFSVCAKDKAKTDKSGEAKELSGISIVGNKEAPKSLFIVPWKSSELGVETSLTSKLLDEKMQVVDKDVFERELDFYSSTTNE